MNVRRVIVLLSVVPLALLGAGSASAGISPAHGGGGGGGSSVTVESLNPGTTTPAAGSTGQMSVELSADAPSGGSVVTLASSNSSALSVPASVTVPAGEHIDDFSYTAGAVTTATAVTVTGTLGSSSASVSLTVTPVYLYSLEFGPSDVVASGGTVTVEPDLSGPAPAGGALVSLTSSDPSLAPVPATAEIPAGDYLISVPVTVGTVSAVTDVTFTASWDGVTLSSQLEIDPPPPPPPPVTPTSVAFSPATVYGTGGSTGTVDLSGPSPAGGTTVTLQITSDFSVTAATVPASVTIPAGATSATFPVTTAPPPDSETPVTISAGIAGTSYASGVVTVIAPGLQSVTLSAGSVAGGGTVTGTATLNTAAPAGGAAVQLISSNTAAATAPASVTVPAGATSATFTVSTLSQKSTTTVAVGGIWAGASRAALLGVTGGRKGGSVLTEPSAEADFPEPSTFDQVDQGTTNGESPHPLEITLESLGSFTASIESGSLPPGLTLETVLSNIAGISGVPTTQGLYAFVLEFTLPSGTVFGWPYLEQITPPMVITATSLPAGTAGQAYDGGFTLTGGVPPYNWLIDAGALPPGLTINPATGQISGTPTTAGTFTFTVEVYDSDIVNTSLFTPETITINPA